MLNFVHTKYNGIPMKSKEFVTKLLSPYLNKKQVVIKKNNLHILPNNVKEVQKILQITHKNNIKLVVQSQGKDWGYTTIKENDIVLNLCNMNNIIEYHEKLAYMIVEPGVTFQQAYEFLKQQKSNLMITTSNGPPNGSILATTLLRGVGKGMNGDLFNYCCNLEAVLNSGKIIRTGFGVYPNAVAQNVHRYGNGPALDGILSQSDIAVVTKMTIWLTPKPAYFSVFTFRLNTDTQIRKFIPTVRYLKMNRIIESNFLLANRYRMLALKYQFPWALTQKIPLDSKVVDKLMEPVGMPEKWLATSIIYEQSKELVRAKQNIIETYLNPIVTNLQFVNEEDIKNPSKYIGDITNTPLFGVPTDNAMRLLYWRKKMPMPKDVDPDRDNCGVYWINGVIPLEEKLIQTALKIAEKLFKKYAFEPNMGVNFVSERAVYLIGMILFDKDISQEEIRAKECYEKMVSEFSKLGIYPFKLTTEERANKNSELQKVLQELVM